MRGEIIMSTDLPFEERMELLEKAVLSYRDLTQLKFLLLLAHKNKTFYVELIYLPSAFVHVAGINKLKDLYIFCDSSASIYRQLIKDDKLKQKIAKSSLFSLIEDRLHGIINLFNSMTENKGAEYFKISGPNNFKYTLIRFDYLVRFTEETGKTNYFYRHRNDSINANEYLLISTFKEKFKDYSKGLVRLSILNEEIYNISSKETMTIFKRN